MKKLLVYAENIERASFFSSLCENLSFVDLENSLFITDKLSVYRYLSSKNFQCVPITKKNLTYPACFCEKNKILVENSINYKRGIVSIKQGLYILNLVRDYLDRNSFIPDGILVFNGESFIDKYLCERFESCKKLYFEVGNFPSRMFVDPLGVNAKSTAFFNQIKANLDYETFDYTDLMEEKRNIPPQAKLTVKDKAFSWVLNFIGILFFGYPYTTFESPLCKWKMFFSSKLSKFLINRCQSNNLDLLEDFIFVPLQVSSDTQIIFNSDVDNEQLIEKAIAKKKNVVVKYHPAERDYRVIKYIYNKYT